MSLSFYYEFTAPAETSAGELEEFLKGVEQLAVSLGFSPTTVLNVPFDSRERRDFSRRLGGNFFVQDERLKGVVLPADGLVRDHDPISGECRLIPQHGVVLVVTDQHGCEACFGFFKFPELVIDIHGAILGATGLEGRWWFRDFVDSPDPRYRKIVQRFAEGGYVNSESEEFK